MKRWTLALSLACGLVCGAPACGDDATRAARESDAGAAGNDAAGQAPTGVNEGGSASVGEAGAGGAIPLAEGGNGAMSVAGSPAAAGDGNTGGAACDAFDDFLAPRELCSSVRTCYPDLQDLDTQCVAPGDGDTVDSYSFFEFANYPNLNAIRACLCALPDQQPARDWVDCVLPADHDAAQCFNACPALGNGCAEPFQVSSMSCNDQHPDGFSAIARCLGAQ
jgi:hypothetical protein